MNPSHLDHRRGALIGLAVGDALGTTLEFQRPGSFTPILGMLGGGPFGLEPGQWTDDTSMALCLAESLLACRGMNAVDQMQRYVRWWKEGHLSSTGECFDIGNTTRKVLRSFDETGDPWQGGNDPAWIPNGSLMRLAPVPVYFADHPELAITAAGESSKPTHAAPICVDACRYVAALIVGAIGGASKDALLGDVYGELEGYWIARPLAPEIHDIAAGSFRTKSPPEIRSTGYVTESLEAALWAFARTSTFADGALLAVNLGGDADTTGAIYGQIAGAFYGESGIPTAWRELVMKWGPVDALAEGVARGA